MAGKDLRLTAIFAVRDQLSPVIQKLAKSWTGLRNTLNSDNFKKLNGQFRQFRRSLTNVTDQVTEAGKKIGSADYCSGSSGWILPLDDDE